MAQISKTRSSEWLGAVLQLFKKSKTAASACASAFASRASRRSSFSASSALYCGQLGLQDSQSVHHNRHAPPALSNPTINPTIGLLPLQGPNGAVTFER